MGNVQNMGRDRENCKIEKEKWRRGGWTDNHAEKHPQTDKERNKERQKEITKREWVWCE